MNLVTLLQTTRRQPPRLLTRQAHLEDVEVVMRQVSGNDELVGRIACEHLDVGGKRVRARLALAACQALGVTTTEAIHWAAAVELLHNATLVHDDVQDGDVARRGKPTAWATHGVPQAINAGDLLLMAPVLAIDRLPASTTTAMLMATLCQRAVATVRGQGADLSLRQQIDTMEPVAAYLRCVEGKTGELMALPVEGAALLAGSSREEARRLAEPFYHLGVLFQLQDDVLDLYGDKGRDQRGADIREGKISALVVEHLRLCPDERERTLAILDTPREQTADADVDFLIARFRDSGALDAVLARITTLATLATHEAEAQLAPLVTELVGVVLAPIARCFPTGASSDASGDANDDTGILAPSLPERPAHTHLSLSFGGTP